MSVLGYNDLESAYCPVRSTLVLKKRNVLSNELEDFFDLSKNTKFKLNTLLEGNHPGVIPFYVNLDMTEYAPRDIVTRYAPFDKRLAFENKIFNACEKNLTSLMN